MKIMVCGSMSFSREMLDAKEKLEKMGHSVSMPCNIDLHISNPGFIDDPEADYKHCVENDVMKKCFRSIEQSDCILVLNYAKNGISGYIGASCLMEIGLAYYLGKKIFLLHDIPNPEERRWAHEIRIMKPGILNGDFDKIS